MNSIKILRIAFLLTYQNAYILTESWNPPHHYRPSINQPHQNNEFDQDFDDHVIVFFLKFSSYLSLNFYKETRSFIILCFSLDAYLMSIISFTSLIKFFQKIKWNDYFGAKNDASHAWRGVNEAGTLKENDAHKFDNGFSDWTNGAHHKAHFDDDGYEKATVEQDAKTAHGMKKQKIFSEFLFKHSTMFSI